MSAGRHNGFPDWDCIRLVAFDVDGTLYNQRRLRALIARDMLLDAMSRCSLDTVIVLKAFRRIREHLGEREVPEFDRVLVTETAKATRHSPERVRSIVGEWIERRPLAYLAACRNPRLADLFAGLRRHKKVIGILSDYPAAAKLDALGLRPDRIICAGDERVRMLKPNPRGLEVLIEQAGATAHQTVLIGDRADRDGVAARRIGAWPLIKSAKPLEGWHTFVRFDDAIFHGLLSRQIP